MSTAPTPSVTLVVETQTHGEGAGLDRFFCVLEMARRMAAAQGRTDVVVADDETDEAIATYLEQRTDVRRFDARGLGYDEMKMRIACEARTDLVVYLDGDCVPESEEWLARHVERIEKDGVAASGGHTVYDGALLARVLTVMDFGFLLPPHTTALGCYAFNNVAFRREVLLETPVPDGPMRCRCYAHAQLLERRGSPVQMTPEAKVRHELPPFFWERYRQGYDVVAACWTDRSLPEARWLALGPFAAVAFFVRTVAYDLRRLLAGRRALGLSLSQTIAALVMLPALRIIDLAGMVRALMMRADNRRSP